MYDDRVDAGKKLAKELRHFKGKDTVVLALPRGGVVVGAEVAKLLHAPLGLVLVKKIGHPSYPEYAIGAVVENEPALYNQDEIRDLDKEWLLQAENAARQLLSERRAVYYGQDFTPPTIKRKLVILVDDGIATGLTMRAAVHAVKNQKAKRVIVAVPVAPAECPDALEDIADEVVILDQPKNFLGAVGNHYHEFDQVDNEEVRLLLREVRDEVQQTVTASTLSAKSGI